MYGAYALARAWRSLPDLHGEMAPHASREPRMGAGGAIGFSRGSPEATAEDQRASPVTTGASDAALAKT